MFYLTSSGTMRKSNIKRLKAKSSATSIPCKKTSVNDDKELSHSTPEKVRHNDKLPSCDPSKSDDIQIIFSRINGRTVSCVDNFLTPEGFKPSSAQMTIQNSPSEFNQNQKLPKETPAQNKSHSSGEICNPSKQTSSSIKSRTVPRKENIAKCSSLVIKSTKKRSEPGMQKVSEQKFQVKPKKFTPNCSQKPGHSFPRELKRKSPQLCVNGMSFQKESTSFSETEHKHQEEPHFRLVTDTTILAKSVSEYQRVRGESKSPQKAHQKKNYVCSKSSDLSKNRFQEICHNMKAYTSSLTPTKSPEYEERFDKIGCNRVRDRNNDPDDFETQVNLDEIKCSNRFENEAKVTPEILGGEYSNRIHSESTNNSTDSSRKTEEPFTISATLQPHKGSGDNKVSSTLPYKHANMGDTQYLNMTPEELQKLEKFRRVNLQIIKAVTALNDFTTETRNETSSIDSDDSEVSELESLEEIRRKAADEEAEEAINQCALEACVFLNQNYPMYFEHLIKRYQLNVYTPDFDEVRRRKMDVIRIASENKDKLERLEKMYRCQR